MGRSRGIQRVSGVFQSVSNALQVALGVFRNFMGVPVDLGVFKAFQECYRAFQRVFEDFQGRSKGFPWRCRAFRRAPRSCRGSAVSDLFSRAFQRISEEY